MRVTSPWRDSSRGYSRWTAKEDAPKRSDYHLKPTLHPRGLLVSSFQRLSRGWDWRANFHSRAIGENPPGPRSEMYRRQLKIYGIRDGKLQTLVTVDTFSERTPDRRSRSRGTNRRVLRRRLVPAVLACYLSLSLFLPLLTLRKILITCPAENATLSRFALKASFGSNSKIGTGERRSRRNSAGQ